MLSLVVYDISDNLSRLHLIKRLQHFGLKRLQKSVFIGHLDLNSRLDLSQDFELYLSSDKDSIVLFPLCDSCKDSILLEGDADIPNCNEEYLFF